MRNRVHPIATASLLALCVACAPGGGETQEGSASVSSGEAHAASDRQGPVSPEFGTHWYQGKAEITSYSLDQARYGEIHSGHAVLIFVTEDFSNRKQVKLDNPSAAGEDAVGVLKLNLTKKFTTGIYPYSVMTSVFTPIDRRSHPKTLKVTTSSQEWCGHTFTQVNLAPEAYRIQQYSYFESEGDVSVDIEPVLLEDEIWTAIRLNPEDLPTGRIRVLPGTIFQRFGHTSWDIATAEATRAAVEGDPERMRYVIRYPDHDRELAIEYRREFPHEIDAWEETARSGFGANAKHLTTRATLKRRIWSDYWTQNGVADVGLRRELGLDAGPQ